VGQTNIQIRGSAGRLLSGSRPAATFLAWEAHRSDVPGGPWRITAEGLQGDPLRFEVPGQYRARLAVGRGEVRGRAMVVHGDEGGTLIFTMEIEHDG
jgi:hypothetical protein